MITTLASSITPDKLPYMVVVGMLGFFTDIKTAIVGLLILIAIDTITGFFAAKPEERNAVKLRKVVKKIISYLTAIIVMHVIEKLILPSYGEQFHLEMARLVSTVISGIEVYSILENLYRLTGLRVFKILTQFTTKKIKEVTDTDISEEKAAK